jgi:TPR repeat protein
MTFVSYKHNATDLLWREAEEAAKRGDFVALVYIWKALAAKGEFSLFGNIGDVYERGAAGVERDIQEALHWYHKGVAELDDPICHIGLGRSYCIGNGVKQDFAAAFSHFESAYAQNCPLAGLYLGKMYYLGSGVKQDIARAKFYLVPILMGKYVTAYILLSRIAFKEWKFFKGILLRVKGHLLGIKIRKENPSDPRLL